MAAPGRGAGPETAYTALVAGDTAVWERATGTAAPAETSAAHGTPAVSAAPRAAADDAPAASGDPGTRGAADAADAAGAAGAGGALRWVAQKVAQTTGVAAGSIDPDAALDAYGIDSIASMRLSRILEDDLGRVPLSVLLDSSSLRDLTARLERAHGPRLAALAGAAREPAPATAGARPSPAAPAVPGAVEGAAASGTRASLAGSVLPERLVGMWAADQAAAPEAPYNVSLAWRLPADVDRAALTAAVTALVRRHPVLACRVRPLDGRPALVPAAETPALVIRTVAGAALDDAVRAEADRRLRTSADPCCGPCCGNRRTAAPPCSS